MVSLLPPCACRLPHLNPLIPGQSCTTPRSTQNPRNSNPSVSSIRRRTHRTRKPRSAMAAVNARAGRSRGIRCGSRWRACSLRLSSCLLQMRTAVLLPLHRSSLHYLLREFSCFPCPRPALRAENLVACADAASFQRPEALQVYYQAAVFGREGSGAHSTSRLNRPALEWKLRKLHNHRLIDYYRLAFTVCKPCSTTIDTFVSIGRCLRGEVLKGVVPIIYFCVLAAVQHGKVNGGNLGSCLRSYDYDRFEEISVGN